jgi:two-component system, cell cycle response regulator
MSIQLKDPIMTKRTVKLLHVEDSRLIHRLVAGLLAKVKDCTFAITVAETEEDAFRAFQSDPAEMVIIDYHLEQGNGLSCLRRLRAIDRAVPILAISGTASAEIAAELLEEGADDFIDKSDLSVKVLEKSVLTALRRADICKQRGLLAADRPRARLKAVCQKLAFLLTDEQTDRFFRHLMELEEAAAECVGTTQATLDRLESLRRECSPVPAESPRGRFLTCVMNDLLSRISPSSQSSHESQATLKVNPC